jgi:hypothetical protein
MQFIWVTDSAVRLNHQTDILSCSWKGFSESLYGGIGILSCTEGVEIKLEEKQKFFFV